MRQVAGQVLSVSLLELFERLTDVAVEVLAVVIGVASRCEHRPSRLDLEQEQVRADHNGRVDAVCPLRVLRLALNRRPDVFQLLELLEDVVLVHVSEFVKNCFFFAGSSSKWSAPA